MGASSRGIGALICVVSVVVGALEIYYGAYLAWDVVPKAVLLPVVVGVLIVVGLGFWLGWIMATTKEAAPVTPSPPPMEEPSEPSEVPTEEVKVERKVEGKPKEEEAPEESPEEKSK